MNKIKQVTIAASTYGVLPRCFGWIQSVWNNLESELNVQLLVVDDGTPNEVAVRTRAEYCKRFNTQFLHNEKNLGIPATWNRIFRTGQENGSDLVVCFNDDIRMLAPGWLPRLMYVFENNDNIGGVGLPLVNEPGFKSDDPRWEGQPGRVGAAVGAAFALRPSALFEITNPDNDNGFWISLRSFHEEVHCGFRLSELGYDSFMLPWPPCYHQGGATFQANEELIWMDLPDYITMDEFLNYARALPFYVPQYEEKYAQGVVDRMMGSRCMFTKYWGLLNEPRMHTLSDGETVDAWASPQRIAHDRIVTPKPKREIKWLDRDGTERISTI